MAGRRPRWPWLLALLLVPLALFIGLRVLLQPERLGALLLERAARDTGLALTVAEPARLGLWPGLQLELVGLQAHVPAVDAAGAPLLHAARVDVALPLSMLWRREELVVGDLRLQAPRLDLPQLLHWITPREGPQAALRLPAVAVRVSIEQGRIDAPGWRVDALDLHLSPLQHAAPAQAHAQLVLQRDGSEPLPLRMRLQAVPHNAPAGLHLGAVDLTLDDAIGPPLTARGQADLEPPQRYAVQLQGALPQAWPAAWPMLPEALSPFLLGHPFRLAYDGSAALDGTLVFASAAPERGIEVATVPAALIDWLGAEARSPLPPLTATVSTPTLDADGARLRGVSLRIEDDPADD